MNVGDKLRVEIADIDKRGKISLVLVEEDAGPSGDGEPVVSPETAPADAATASS